MLAGIDVLARDGFAALKGKRVGLVTNHTGRARDGATTIDLLHTAPGVPARGAVQPRARHPRHPRRRGPGVARREDRPADPLAVYRAERGGPPTRCSQGIDTMVVDLQDVGARFYTYHTTMGYVMEEAAKRKIAVVVLDRPNPVNGWQIEGPLCPSGAGRRTSSRTPTMPVRHGMTMGELAKLFNEERKIGADLTVVPMANWRRDQWFDETGLTWVNPSPNMRNLTQAALYPGVGAIEYANVSVGRGTDQPFEQIGAPWMDGPRLAAALNARPAGHPLLSGRVHAGVEQVRQRAVPRRVHDRHQPRRAAARARRPGDRRRTVGALAGSVQAGDHDRLLGSRDSFERVKRGEDPAAVAARWSGVEARWRRCGRSICCTAEVRRRSTRS